MRIGLLFFPLFVSHIEIECIRIGLIQNVSLTGGTIFELNGTSCDECACLLVQNNSFTSFNCYLSNKTCDIFGEYNATVNHQLTDNRDSNFYFLTLPPYSVASKALSTQTNSGQSTNLPSYGSMTTAVISTNVIITTAVAIETSTIRITTTVPVATSSSAITTATNPAASSSPAITTVPAASSSPAITTTVAVTTSITKTTTTTATTDLCPYTAAGRCNSTSGSDSFSLNQPIDVFVNKNGSVLYVGEYGNSRVQAFQLPSKSGTTVPTTVSGVLGIYYNDNNSTLYVSEYATLRLSIWPSGKTLPLNATGSACSTMGGWFGMPYGMVGNGQGTTYVTHNTCHTIVKWIPNATQPLLIGGNGTNGGTVMQLNSPRHIHLDEVNSFIYVADTNNHRIQRFSTNGNGNGTTVAGGNGQGKASNQLNSPTGVYVSWKDGSIYVSDQMNHRIQKWLVNASSGVTVAGYSNGSSGNGPFALNKPFALTLDPNETYMYIADYNNNRVQRYPVI